MTRGRLQVEIRARSSPGVGRQPLPTVPGAQRDTPDAGGFDWTQPRRPTTAGGFAGWAQDASARAMVSGGGSASFSSPRRPGSRNRGGHRANQGTPRGGSRQKRRGGSPSPHGGGGYSRRGRPRDDGNDEGASNNDKFYDHQQDSTTAPPGTPMSIAERSAAGSIFPPTGPRFAVGMRRGPGNSPAGKRPPFLGPRDAAQAILEHVIPAPGTGPPRRVHYRDETADDSNDAGYGSNNNSNNNNFYGGGGGGDDGDDSSDSGSDATDPDANEEGTTGTDAADAQPSGSGASLLLPSGGSNGNPSRENSAASSGSHYGVAGHSQRRGERKRELEDLRRENADLRQSLREASACIAQIESEMNDLRTATAQTGGDGRDAEEAATIWREVTRLNDEVRKLKEEMKGDRAAWEREREELLRGHPKPSTRSGTRGSAGGSSASASLSRRLHSAAAAASTAVSGSGGSSLSGAREAAVALRKRSEVLRAGSSAMVLVRSLASVRKMVTDRSSVRDAVDYAHFVPRLVQEMLVDPDPETLNSPGLRTFDGAVVFADTSGFTALSKALEKTMGAGAAEKLCSILDGYFELLIQIIHAHGGDIVKFAGDALLIVWNAERYGGNLTRCTQIASHCAVVATKSLHNFDTGHGVKLSLHSGVGCGRIHSLYVGGVFGRWEYTIVGQPMREIAVAVDLAARGEIAVSPRVWTHIASSSDGNAIPGTAGYVMVESMEEVGESPLPELELMDEEVKMLGRYVPAAVKAAVASGGQSKLAEIREISVVFISLLGMRDLSHDGAAPPDLNLWHDVVVCLQKTVYKYEGSINKILVDDKGVIAVAVFGLPPLPHPDDPVRACIAALVLSSRLRELGVHSKIGITSGRTFCGTVGSELRSEYTVMGSLVNISARLMGSAEVDTVLVDVTTRDDTKSQFKFDRLEPLKLKGLPEPVQAFRAVRKVHSVRKPDPPFVGRAEEVELLRAAIDEYIAAVEGITPAGSARAGSAYATSQQARALRRVTSSDIVNAITGGKPKHLHVGGGAGAGGGDSNSSVSSTGGGAAQNVAALLGAGPMRAARALSTARAAHRRGAHGQCVLIRGPVGVGKTRLLDTMVDRARAIGLLHARGSAHSTRTGAMLLRGKPYAALRGMILELFGGTSGDIGEIGMQVQGFLLPGEPNLAPLLNDAIEGLDLPENEDTLSMTAGERARRLSALLRRVFASVTTGCLLAVDNYHTLDNASWALLRACVDMGFLVALAGRSTGPQTVELVQLEQLPETLAIDVGPLDLEASRSMVHFEFFGAHAPESSAVPDPLVRKISEWTEGNPFWICETVQYLISHRIVEVSHGLIRLRRKLSEEPVPRPIESAIVSVIDALQPQLRVVLKTACVIGRRFAMLQLIRAAADHFTERQLASAAEQLSADGMMLRRIPRPDDEEGDAVDDEIDGLVSAEDENPGGSGNGAEKARRAGNAEARRRMLATWYEFRSVTTYTVILSRMLASQRLSTMARAQKSTRLRDGVGSQPNLHRIASGIAISDEGSNLSSAFSDSGGGGGGGGYNDDDDGKREKVLAKLKAFASAGLLAKSFGGFSPKVREEQVPSPKIATWPMARSTSSGVSL